MEQGETRKTRTKRRSAAKAAQILDRGSKILELRKNGASLRAISRELTKQAEANGESTRGYSYEQIRRVYQEIVDLRIEEQQDALEEIRVLCAERLEDILINYMPYARTRVDALTPDNLLRMKLKAGDTVIKAVKELAELYGAKRPQKLEVTGEDGKPLNVVTQVIVEFTNEAGEDRE